MRFGKIFGESTREIYREFFTHYYNRMVPVIKAGKVEGRLAYSENLQEGET